MTGGNEGRCLTGGVLTKDIVTLFIKPWAGSITEICTELLPYHVFQCINIMHINTVIKNYFSACRCPLSLGPRKDWSNGSVFLGSFLCPVSRASYHKCAIDAPRLCRNI
jgi:hypothetical protein